MRYSTHVPARPPQLPRSRSAVDAKELNRIENAAHAFGTPVTRSLLVVCPARNEVESIAGVVAEVQAAVPHAEVLVVDDGSTDATASVARRAGARVVQLPFNVGVGGALRAGILLGQREAADAVVQCDADGQHPAGAIPSLVARLETADVVVGSRWAGSGDYAARGPRRWAMRLLAAILSRVHGTELSDVTSGFRAFGPRAIAVFARELPPEYLGDTIDALVIAKAHGLRVAQVPVAMRSRTAGIASHRPLRAALYLGRAMLVLLLSLARLLASRPRPAP
jgi:glycosyltransferase involved in cell wall biosynthesis